jgi:pyruvyltransferase
MLTAKWATSANWGDSLNPILIEKISGRKPILANTNPNYLCIGSVLQWAGPSTIVWGTGFIGEDRRLSYKVDIRAVRGPLTRNIILNQGYDCPEVYGDPALLYTKFYKPKTKKKYQYGIIPHYIDQKSPWLNQFKNNPNVKIIDIVVPSEEHRINRFIDEVNECEVILSSSLHGIILGDSLGIPSYWIELSDKVIGKGFKFTDYFLSVNRPVVNPIIPNSLDRIKDISSAFYKYKINIDLDLLYSVCPFKR